MNHRELQRDAKKLSTVRRILESLSHETNAAPSLLAVRGLEQALAEKLGRSPLSAAERREA